MINKLQICKKVEEMIVAHDPLLANKEYRIRMNRIEKIQLVVKMMNLANKVAMMNGV